MTTQDSSCVCHDTALCVPQNGLAEDMDYLA